MPDPDQFTRVITEHHSSLRHYIGAFGVNPAWVDDIAQDTFLVVYRKWDQFQTVENPGAWLRGIAKKLVLNETAKLSRRQRLLSHKLTELLVEAEGEDADLGDPCRYADKLESLRACLAGLTPKARSVIDARYFANRNSFEIAAELAMKPAAVRKLLFYARQSLSNCLQTKSTIVS